MTASIDTVSGPADPNLTTSAADENGSSSEIASRGFSEGFSGDVSEDFPYRAISKSAIAALVLFVLSLVGWLAAPVLAFAAVGMFVAFFAIRAIKAYPNEFSGMALAKFALLANAVCFFGGIGYHAYIYVTEVPEGYTRVHFWELQQPDGAVDVPTERAVEVNGGDIFLKGYVHPASGNGMLRRFIMVPDLGTCCFGGQPKSSDMIDVTLNDGQTLQNNKLKKKLAGRFLVTAPGKKQGFDNGIFYQFRVDKIR